MLQALSRLSGRADAFSLWMDRQTDRQRSWQRSNKRTSLCKLRPAVAGMDLIKGVQGDCFSLSHFALQLPGSGAHACNHRHTALQHSHWAASVPSQTRTVHNRGTKLSVGDCKMCMPVQQVFHL